MVGLNPSLYIFYKIEHSKHRRRVADLFYSKNRYINEKEKEIHAQMGSKLQWAAISHKKINFNL